MGMEWIRDTGTGRAIACVTAIAGLGLAGCGGDESADGSLRADGSTGADGSMQNAPGSQMGASNGPNEVPVVESVDMRPGKPAPGRTVQANAVISDPDGDATMAQFVWQSSGGKVLGEGRRFDTTGLYAGDRLKLVVTASDGQSESAPYVHRFELAEPSVEVALVVIDSSQGTAPGSTLKAVVEATGQSRKRQDVVVEWRVKGEVIGRELELDTTSLLPGDVVELRASLDFGDRKSRPVSAKSLVLARGGAPEIISEPIAGIEGGEFRYQIRAKSSGRGTQFSYELLDGPDGMSVNEKSGLVSWRPSTSQRGEFRIEVAAHDQWGSGSAQSFTITVAPPESAPASAR